MCIASASSQQPRILIVHDRAAVTFAFAQFLQQDLQMKIVFAFVALSLFAACSSDEPGLADLGLVDMGADIVVIDSPADSPADAPMDAPVDSAIDASVVDAGAGVACGETTCDVGNVCVHPCCGGAPPPCFPPDDAGVCPEGTTLGTCAMGGGTGCTPGPCTPPAPSCVDAPTPGTCTGSSCPECSGTGGAGIYDEASGSISCLCA